MSRITYNTIGKDYNSTRRADPYITDRLFVLLHATPGGNYLDVGCGTGNYLTALSERGLQFTGLDPSQTMLEKAQARNSGARFVSGKVEELPFADEEFDGVLAMFTMHHWDNLAQGLKEIVRVLKPGGRLVCLSFTPEQVRQYWLNEYFPRMMKRSWELLPEHEDMECMLLEAGFASIATEKYFVQEDLTDHFLYSNKHRPQAYLDPMIRQNASSFSAFSEQEEVDAGLKRLKADIGSGRIEEVMKRYENEDGDYMFFVAGV